MDDKRREVIEAVLSEHPAVATVSVDEDFQLGRPRVVAHVALQAEGSSILSAEDAAVWRWRMLFDSWYMRSKSTDARFDFAGWDSSYTGEPIPLQEMHEWLEATVNRIVSLNPRRVLELGVGTGLLLHQIAPRCERYVGTDFSATGLERLNESVKDRGLEQVTLLERSADNLSGLGAAFDTVILNSVSQCFPSVEFLVKVIEGAQAVLGSDGTLFVGDVRDYSLLEAFDVSVELFNANADTTAGELTRRISGRVEEELLVAPSLFFALARELNGVANVSVLHKRGRFRNEMNCFRYDAVMRKGARDLSTPVRTVDWPRVGGQEGLAVLLDSSATALRVAGVPNPRVWNAFRARDDLRELRADESVAPMQIERVLDSPDPEAACLLGHSRGRRCELHWSGAGAADRYDALFLPEGSVNVKERRPEPTPAGSDVPALLNLADHANRPSSPSFNQRLLIDLWRHARNYLSPQDCPTSLVLVGGPGRRESPPSPTPSGIS